MNTPVESPVQRDICITDIRESALSLRRFSNRYNNYGSGTGDASSDAYYRNAYYSGMRVSPHTFGYSGKLAGAMLALGEIRDAVPVIHGSCGCGFHYRYVCRREYLPVYRSTCSDIKESDIIFGGAEKLKKAILAAAEEYAPALIGIVPSAPADLLHEDIEAVADELRSRIPCRIIPIVSREFSLVDKRERRKHCEEQAKRGAGAPLRTTDFSGCGFVEVMNALVDSVMEEQKVIPRTVNICGLAWGAGASAVTSGMLTELSGLGITCNTFLPNCNTASIVTAPRAELTILTRRIEWAERMRNRFGTDFFHLDSFSRYQGPGGIAQLYYEIACRMGIEHAKNGERIGAYLTARKERALAALQEDRAFFSAHRFGLFSRSFSETPPLIQLYERDFGIPLSFVCIDSGGAERDELSPVAVSLWSDQIKEALSESGSKASFIPNCSASELCEIFDSVDVVIGGRASGVSFCSAAFVQNPRQVSMLDFAGFVQEVRDFACLVKQSLGNKDLLLDHLSFSGDSYPIPNRKNLNGARQLWDKVWTNRKQVL